MTVHDERPSTMTASDVLRVMICEDAEDTRVLLAEMVQLRGHVVETAGDGESAIKSIVDGRFDVAVIDIGLPGISGYEVARAVRRHPSVPGIRLVALSGFASPDDQANAKSAGFDAWLTKPVKMDVLLAALRGPV